MPQIGLCPNKISSFHMLQEIKICDRLMKTSSDSYIPKQTSREDFEATYFLAKIISKTYTNRHQLLHANSIINVYSTSGDNLCLPWNSSDGVEVCFEILSNFSSMFSVIVRSNPANV